MATATAAGFLKPITSFEVVGIPVGKALVFTGAIGVGDAVKAFLAPMLPGAQWPVSKQFVVGLGTAWALTAIKPVRNLVGPEVAQLAALAILADTLNDEFKIQEKVGNLIAGLGGKAVVSNSPPVLINRNQAQIPASNRAGVRNDLYAGVF